MPTTLQFTCLANSADSIGTWLTPLLEKITRMSFEEITKGIKVSAFSTIAGSFILNSIIAETAKLAKNDDPFPFYISSNMPKSKEHNEMLLKKYRARNPHL